LIRRALTTLVLGLAVSLALPLSAQLQRPSKATLNLAADRTAYEPGSEATVGAFMTIDTGWHTNSHEPTFEYLIPTILEVSLPEGWEPARISYPAGEMKTFSFEELPLSVYEGEVELRATLQVPADAPEGSATVEAILRYQACDDRSCLPPTTAEARLDLTIGGGGAETGDVSSAAEADAGTAGAGGEGTRANLGVILLLALVGGLILNAMPCVLPVLSLKIFGLVKSAGEGRSAVVASTLSTAAGILVSFWALAAAAVFARSAGAAVGWGVQFQEPVFVTFLTIVVLLFTLNLWGVFEVPLPAFVQRVSGSGASEGIPGHFVSGLFATLMATPCSAPFLGTALSFALTQPAATVFLTFTAVGLGMSLPYLAVAATPRSLAFLPKPGAWMEKLKVFMGFLLAGAAVWLLYVLAAQMPSERVAMLQLSLLVLAFFVWLRSSGGSVSRKLAVLGIVAAIASSFWIAASARGQQQAVAASEEVRLISWASFDRIEANRLRDEGRLVFVDVTADWCFTCKVNERLVLETEEIAELFERHEVVPMKADWTNRSDTIAAFLSDHGRYGIPFYLLYRPGQEPYLFGELLNKDTVIEAVEAAASESSRITSLSP
jgi:suppressor for copper-sensitivity B